ncbi:DUF5065 family protein [Bacillus toyonensis]|uniref:DUF5065 family protein n=1 Tax=Bacillus toyonensis TaxID=155322 RepID=UPI000BF192D4|nr:DUF5065 family protein [Bacillus toyonensis]PEJ00575.1 hypothetical protein CN671_19495 [Bacillus toyonensis]
MKKFTSVALAGAIALGGITVAEFSKPTKAAAAGYDEWGIFTQNDLIFIDPMSNSMNNYFKISYAYNQNFHVETTDFNWAPTTENIMKIFKAESDGSLSRYKTITPKITYITGSQILEWDTTITTGYTTGKYVAVVYDAQNKHYMKSKFFNIQ